MITKKVIKDQIQELKKQHTDLDRSIYELVMQKIVDQFKVQDLKKRKLLIKEQISNLERSLNDDIIA